MKKQRLRLLLLMICASMMIFSVGCSKIIDSLTNTEIEKYTLNWSVEPNTVTFNVGEKITFSLGLPADFQGGATASWGMRLREGQMSGYPSTGDTFEVTPLSSPFLLEVTGEITNYSIENAEIINPTFSYTINISSNIEDTTSDDPAQDLVQTKQLFDITPTVPTTNTLMVDDGISWVVSPNSMVVNREIIWDDLEYTNTGDNFKHVSNTQLTVYNPGEISIILSTKDQTRTLNYKVMPFQPKNYALAGFSSDENITDETLFFADDVAHMAYLQNEMIYIYKNQDEKWELLTSLDVGDISFHKVIIQDSDIYVGYISKNDDAVTIKKFSGSNWAAVGQTDFADSDINAFDFMFINDTLYAIVASDDRSKLVEVFKYDDDWQTVYSKEAEGMLLLSRITGVALFDKDGELGFVYAYNQISDHVLVILAQEGDMFHGKTASNLVDRLKDIKVGKDQDKYIITGKGFSDQLIVYSMDLDIEELREAEYSSLENFSVIGDDERIYLAQKDNGEPCYLFQFEDTDLKKITTTDALSGEISDYSLSIKDSTPYITIRQKEKHLIFLNLQQ